MLIVSTLVLSVLVAAQVTTRIAQTHFAEFRALPHLPQES
jgi:hypothetical protein